uniref:Holin n=1 Tax=Pseudomonas phage Cygsa01 TaxID=3138529 RepID=A0AAU6W3B4_9VIRU
MVTIQLVPIIAWLFVLFKSIHTIRLCKCKVNPKRKEASIILTSATAAVCSIILQLDIMLHGARYEAGGAFEKMYVAVFLLFALWDIFILRYISETSNICKPPQELKT